MDEEEATIRGGAETILLVDDEPAVLETANEILQIYGYQVVNARTGEEALKHYVQTPNRFDLVVLDLGMPGMGGRECLRKLRELNPAVRVVVVSGYVGGSNVGDVTREGAMAFLGKPYRLNELASMVRQCLDVD